MYLLELQSDKCKGTDYQCDNGKCISRYKVCDGTVDCISGIDEYMPCLDSKSLKPAPLQHSMIITSSNNLKFRSINVVNCSFKFF